MKNNVSEIEAIASALAIISIENHRELKLIARHQCEFFLWLQAKKYSYVEQLIQGIANSQKISCCSVNLSSGIQPSIIRYNLSSFSIF